MDRRLGVGQPPGYPFNLNSAVDALLKKEFDLYRELGQPHPLILEYNINAIPFKHEKIEEWRDSLRKGIQFHVPNTNIMLTGGVDDVWIDIRTHELIIVDYKATSKQGEVSIDAEWQIGYKRQAEVYQWLFRQNGFRVATTSYFVYCNGKVDRPRFDRRLDFSVTVLPYLGNTDWVEPAILSAYQCLKSPVLPEASSKCDFCAYILSVNHEVHQHQNPEKTGCLF